MSTLFASRLALLAIASSSLAAVVAACSANGTGDGIVTEQEAGATEPPEIDLLPPTSGEGGASDARLDATSDGGKDAAKDAAVDAGKSAPDEGVSCGVIDEIFTRACGACGTQQAICLPNDGGAGGVVSMYSACGGELDGGCVPGTTDNEACGNCGSRVRTCNKYCAWTAGACTGEPPSSCSPTTSDYTTAGCATAGTYRQRQCGAACTWSPFSSCGELDFELTAAPNAGEIVSGIYPLRALVADKRIGGTCGSNYYSSSAMYPYVYVEVKNPTDQTLTISAWNAAAPNGGLQISTVMTVYATTAKPPAGDDIARKACVKTVSTYCPSTVPCGWSSFAALTGTNAFTIAPKGSVLVFFQSYYEAGGSSPAEGDVKLVARTDAVAP